MARTKIVYLPFPIRGNKINEYTTNMVKLLQENYQVVGSLAEATDILQMMQTKAVFLNWVEDELDKKMKLQLLLYKLLGAKVVWVFHNKFPHDTAGENATLRNMKWLSDNSSVIALHSKSSRKFIPGAERNKKKAVFVPHILYQPQNENVDINMAREKYGILKEDFVFTMFGVIRPYKNIEGTIEAFKALNLKNAKLLIAGNPVNGAYAKKIEELAGNDENIILDLQYISNVMLDNIIDISDVVVMPYADGSSMNSGVMIQAFSKGTTVIAPDICMARDMAKEKFFYLYRSSLQKIMQKAYHNGKTVNADMGSRAKQYMMKYNDKKAVKEKINKILYEEEMV